MDNVNKRAPWYYIAETMRTCWSCRARTPVIGLVMPPGHESLEVVGYEPDERYVWMTMGAPSFVHYVTHLPASVVNTIEASAWPLSRTS